MKVYISGPMSGYEDFNRQAFHNAARWLRHKGYEVVNPAELDDSQPMPHDARHGDYLRRDIRELVECDLILMLPGWKHSKGATGEKATADLCGIDELTLADVDLWRTFEGEPSGDAEVPGAWPEGHTKGCEKDTDHKGLCTPDIPSLPVHRIECEAVDGDADGNLWCVHGIQIAFAPKECDGKRGGRCEQGTHVFDGHGRLSHVSGRTAC